MTYSTTWGHTPSYSYPASHGGWPGVESYYSNYYNNGRYGRGAGYRGHRNPYQDTYNYSGYGGRFGYGKYSDCHQYAHLDDMMRRAEQRVKQVEGWCQRMINLKRDVDHKIWEAKALVRQGRGQGANQLLRDVDARIREWERRLGS